MLPSACVRPCVLGLGGCWALRASAAWRTARMVGPIVLPPSSALAGSRSIGLCSWLLLVLGRLGSLLSLIHI
eukprot:9688523-Alexandrium_andersonii.AAC.1